MRREVVPLRRTRAHSTLVYRVKTHFFSCDPANFPAQLLRPVLPAPRALSCQCEIFLSTSATWARVAEGEGHTVHTAPLPRVAGPPSAFPPPYSYEPRARHPAGNPPLTFPPRSPHPCSLPTDPRRQQPNLRPPPPPRRLLAGSLPRPPIPLSECRLRSALRRSRRLAASSTSPHRASRPVTEED